MSEGTSEEIRCDRCKEPIKVWWDVKEKDGSMKRLCGMCFHIWAREHYPPIKFRQERDLIP